MESLRSAERRAAYRGPVTRDHYGRELPGHAHGTANLGAFSASGKRVEEAALSVFDRTADPALLFRRVTITANHIVPERERQEPCEQLDLFTDQELLRRRDREREELRRERQRQTAMLAIKQKYGKNAILRGTNFLPGATARERNRQIGGHRA